MRINKDIRNILMIRDEFMVTGNGEGVYLGKKYTYVPVTKAERKSLINRLQEVLTGGEQK